MLVFCKLNQYLTIKIAEKLFLPSVGFKPTTSDIRDQRPTSLVIESKSNRGFYKVYNN